jgi:DNA-binding transcriptional regulator GbsR (MarR family)
VQKSLGSLSSLTDAQARFVLQWSELGTRFGINRTVAKVHALLLLAPCPLSAGDMSAALSISPSSVSNSLRELQDAGLVRGVQALGDRRDRFEAVKDAWESGRLLLDDRKRRAFDPALEILRDAVNGTEGSTDFDTKIRSRLRELLHFFEMLDAGLSILRRIPDRESLRRVEREIVRLSPEESKTGGGARPSKLSSTRSHSG